LLFGSSSSTELRAIPQSVSSHDDEHLMSLGFGGVTLFCAL
jgi:hypothetical protein